MTAGLTGQFDTAIHTPLSDPNYWRAVRSIVMAEAAAIGLYNQLAAGLAPPSTPKGLMKYGDRMGAPSGRVPPGTFDEVFESSHNRVYSSEGANAWWAERGYDNPPYKPNTLVEEITLTEETRFVRVYDGENSGMAGGWMMREEDILGLTPEEIQNKYALPVAPKYIVDVIIPEGSTIRGGIANGIPEWGEGGGYQYDLMWQRIGEFVNPRPIEGGE